MDSDDCHSDLSSDEDEPVEKVLAPKVSYRFVQRLENRRSMKKMRNEENFRDKFIWHYIDSSKIPENISTLTDDSEDEPEPNLDLDEIRKKTDEFDRKQIKTIQMANAGSQNPRILNSSAVTSNACSIL